ncbi:TonB-dependent receptor [Flavobacterium sp. TMP13]|uniref:TonB-dependent receptor n=1 Tax=Flavobacterium sp. TMP13 TaxID=3425950 RepID=UPI003D77B3BB
MKTIKIIPVTTSILHWTLLLFLCLSCTVAFSQMGKVSGKILLGSAQPLPGANILLHGNDIQRTAVTGIDGEYLMENVPFGRYEIEISSLESEQKTQKINHNSAHYSSNTIVKKAASKELNAVVIRSNTKKKQLETKGFAVNVIDTKNFELQSIQLNELLDQTAGVRVRRSGGLGSNAEYIINGMSGNSVRIFIDGIPIRNYGPSFSLNSLPVALIERVEIYKGVVPAHLADDAMGGAINVVLKNAAKNNLTASVSGGSFNTFQTDVTGSYRNEKNGQTFRGSAFLNYADNDYTVWGDQVAVQLAPGTPDVYVKAKRFHDRYRSQGTKAEFGFTDVQWADKLLFGMLLSRMDQQIQNGATMEIVYGNRFAEQNTAMYSVDFSKKNILKNLDASAFVSLSRLTRNITDTIATQYSWLGYSTNYFNNPDVWASGAEAGNPTLQEDLDINLNSKANLTYKLNAKNSIQFNYLANRFSRDSDDSMLPTIERAMQEERSYFKNIFSLSYENRAFDNRLRTTVFAKSYHLNRLSKIRQRTGNSASATITIIESKNKSDDLGFGGAISYNITRQLSIFGSAEKAVRLPEAGEVFGNVAGNINPAINLKPEKSNNYNLGISFDNINYNNHKLNVRGNVFIRDTKDLIMQLPVGNTEEFFQNSNVGKIYTEGLDLELHYNYNKLVFFNANTSVFAARDYNVTYDSSGNTITPTYERLPNTPYFTMNYNLRLDQYNFIQEKAKFSFYYNILYVHEFFRHGNALGGAGKTIIPTQLSNDTGIAYTFPKKKLTLSIDAKNIFNQQIFDNYALQKPGRACYAKLTYTLL